MIKIYLVGGDPRALYYQSKKNHQFYTTVEIKPPAKNDGLQFLPIFTQLLSYNLDSQENVNRFFIAGDGF